MAQLPACPISLRWDYILTFIPLTIRLTERFVLYSFHNSNYCFYIMLQAICKIQAFYDIWSNTVFKHPVALIALFVSYNIFPSPMQLINSPPSSHIYIHRLINNITTQAGWRTYIQRGIHGENNYTNTLKNCTVTHNTHVARNAAQINPNQKTSNNLVWSSRRWPQE
jgi:hypothetical protein